MIYTKISSFSSADKLIKAGHSLLFIKFKHLSFITALFIYLTIIILTGNTLKISANYFVLLPIIAGALSYGFLGGILIGTMALPANLLLFLIIGHTEFSPENRIIAEFAGILVGTTLGYFSDYFYRLDSEIKKRKEIADSLENVLAEKELLMKEIHHRVNNNLNIIKSLIQLQINRSENEELNTENQKLIQRIYAIALVHEQIFARTYTTASLLTTEYVPELVRNILSSMGKEITSKYINIGKTIHLSMETTPPMGLIINEVITNSIKYAFSNSQDRRVWVTTRGEEELLTVIISDNGGGVIPEKKTAKGLGMKLIEALTNQLGGVYSYSKGIYGGVDFCLKIPLIAKNSENEADPDIKNV